MRMFAIPTKLTGSYLNSDCVLWEYWPFQQSWLVLTYILTVYYENISHSSKVDWFLPEFWLCTKRMFAIPTKLTGSNLNSDCVLWEYWQFQQSWLVLTWILTEYYEDISHCSKVDRFLPEFWLCTMRILAIPAKLTQLFDFLIPDRNSDNTFWHLKIRWAASCQNQQNGMCAQRRLRSA